jgi:hypothetical protein
MDKFEIARQAILMNNHQRFLGDGTKILINGISYIGKNKIFKWLGIKIFKSFRGFVPFHPFIYIEPELFSNTKLLKEKSYYYIPFLEKQKEGLFFFCINYLLSSKFRFAIHLKGIQIYVKFVGNDGISNMIKHVMKIARISYSEKKYSEIYSLIKMNK